MKKEATATVKKTAKKEKPMDVVVETPASASTNGIQMSTVTKIALGVGVGLLLIGGVLYNRYWNIATVNGKAISRLAYYQMIEKQAGKQALDNMIMETLIKSEAEKNNVSVPQEKIDAEISQIENQMKSQGTSLDDALVKEGMTREDLQNQIRVQQLVQMMGKGDSTVTEEQITKYLTENKDMLPKNSKPEELKELAREQLSQQSESDSIKAWLAKLRSDATINYY